MIGATGIVLGTLQMGGAERQALLLAAHLVRQGTPVFIAGPPPTAPEVADRCRRDGIPLVELPRFESRRGWLCALRMWRAALRLRRRRPRMLIAFTWPANVLCGCFRDWIGARTVVWGQRDAGIGRLVPRLERRALARIDRAVANGPAAARFLRDVGLPARQLSLVANAVDLPPPAAAAATWRARLAVPADRQIAVMLAHLHRHKDHATALRAWALVVEASRGREPVLVLAGRHDEALPELRRLADGLAIAGHVRFPGAVEDVAGLLATCDLAVFSSRSEGCPNGVLEAMASGLAVVATDIPGIRAALADPRQLVPAQADAIAAVVLRLLGDDALRTRLGSGNRERVRLRFSPTTAFARWDAVLAAAARTPLAPRANREG